MTESSESHLVESRTVTSRSSSANARTVAFSSLGNPCPGAIPDASGTFLRCEACFRSRHSRWTIGLLWTDVNATRRGDEWELLLLSVRWPAGVR